MFPYPKLARYLYPFLKQSYSQSKEDLILNIILSDIKSGFYVDVGANNPIIQSNTFFFIKKVGVELT